MKLPARVLAYCALLAALMAVSAWISFPLPPFPGKVTLQLAVVFLCAHVLSPRWAPLPIALYIALGLVGIPLFSQGGGIQYFLQPTFGYLLGFLLAAPVMSWMLRTPKLGRLAPFPRYAAATCAGLALTYALGAPYMSLVMTLYLDRPMSLWTAVLTGCLMFLPVDLAKAALVYPAGRIMTHHHLTL